MNTTDKRLYLIDGHALIYRAYYALIRNPLTNTKGVPTGAVYGFANYLLRLLETHDCQYWAIALDSDKPTFRHEMYAEYKANREEMPDDLKTQIPLVNDLIDAMNIPSVRKEGVEADDLIAALTGRAVAQGFEVCIISKDKDLMQLVGPGVRMLAPGNFTKDHAFHDHVIGIYEFSFDLCRRIKLGNPPADHIRA